MSPPPPHNVGITIELDKVKKPHSKNKNSLQTHTPQDETQNTSKRCRSRNPNTCRTNYHSRQIKLQSSTQINLTNHGYIRPHSNEQIGSNLCTHIPATCSAPSICKSRPTALDIELAAIKESNHCSKEALGRAEVRETECASRPTALGIVLGEIEESNYCENEAPRRAEARKTDYESRPTVVDTELAAIVESKYCPSEAPGRAVVRKEIVESPT